MWRSFLQCSLGCFYCRNPAILAATPLNVHSFIQPVLHQTTEQQLPTLLLVASPCCQELDDSRQHLEQAAQAAIPQLTLPFPTKYTALSVTPTTYRVGYKKVSPNILHIILSTTSQFSKFFHYRVLQKISKTAITKYHTSSQTCRYTLSWNTNVRKLVTFLAHSVKCMQLYAD